MRHSSAFICEILVYIRIILHCSKFQLLQLHSYLYFNILNVNKMKLSSSCLQDSQSKKSGLIIEKFFKYFPFIVTIQFYFTENTEVLDTIASNVRINNGTFENLAEKKLTVRRRRETITEDDRLAEEEYNKKTRETQYKRLMHLLDRSQFYSKYLVNKMEQEMEKEAKKKSVEKRKKNRRDENSPPKKIQKKITKSDEQSVIREYVKMKDVSVSKSTVLIFPLVLYISLFTIVFYLYGLLAQRMQISGNPL